MRKLLIFILISITAIIGTFGLSQHTVIKNQEAELSALKVQQATDATQTQQLLEEKKSFDSRFNEVLDRLKKVTQAKMTLEFQFENAQALIQKLEEEKKSLDSSVKAASVIHPVKAAEGFAILEGKLIYWNKSITWVTKEKPTVEIKDMKTGQVYKDANVLVKGSKYIIENLPLGKYQVSVRVNVPYKKDRHIPEELKGDITVEFLENGKTVVQDITLG